MKSDEDAYGQQLLAQFNHQTPTAEIIERDDDYIDTGSDAGQYFAEYADWSPLEQRAVSMAAGKILDIGCGAGRHALYLQEKGFDVTGIDNSPGAVEVCRRRGLRKAFVRPIENVGEFAADSFDTILLLGSNFGLLGDAENTRAILEKFERITSPHARIIAGTHNPYQTDAAEHLEYHELNRRRGRLPGQIKMRVRYGKTVGAWFDYLFVSPDEMLEILEKTNWEIEELIGAEKANYFAVIRKEF